MKIHLTPDSVRVGDDVDAPHIRAMSFADEMPLDSVIHAISRSGYLASIVGGEATTWSAVAGQPIAVVTQRWSQTKLLPNQPMNLSLLKGEDGVARLHFRYHAQDDPNTVFATLTGQHVSKNLFKIFLGIALECNRDEWMQRMRRMGSCPCKQPGRQSSKFIGPISPQCDPQKDLEQVLTTALGPKQLSSTPPTIRRVHSYGQHRPSSHSVSRQPHHANPISKISHCWK